MIIITIIVIVIVDQYLYNEINIMKYYCIKTMIDLITISIYIWAKIQVVKGKKRIFSTHMCKYNVLPRRPACRIIRLSQ